MTKEYEPSEKDINTVISILKRTDPKHATPEWANLILDHIHAALDDMSFSNPEKLEGIIQDIEKKRLSS